MALILPPCYGVSPNLENTKELAAGLTKAIRLTNGEPYSFNLSYEGVAFPDDRTVRPRIVPGGGFAIDRLNQELRPCCSYQIGVDIQEAMGSCWRGI